MLRWPSRATPAIRELFKSLQDIDVYVEDMDDEPFYRTLLQNATNGQVRIARVFSLGTRQAVLTAAEGYDHSLRPALFIIDGDLTWVKGDPPPSVTGVHQHDAYCVENLLLCEQAIARIVSDELAIMIEDAKTKFGYQDWRTNVTKPLTTLFAAFATVYEFDPATPTVSIGIGNLCIQKSKKVFCLDESKIAAAVNASLAAAKAKAQSDAVDSRFDIIRRRISGLADPLRAVSGKDFLLPLLRFALHSIGCNLTQKKLRFRLAGNGESDRFGQLAAALLDAARPQYQN